MKKYYVSVLTYGGNFDDSFQFYGYVNSLTTAEKLIDQSHLKLKDGELEAALKDNSVFRKTAENRGGGCRVYVTNNC